MKSTPQSRMARTPRAPGSGRSRRRRRGPSGASARIERDDAQRRAALERHHRQPDDVGRRARGPAARPSGRTRACDQHEVGDRDAVMRVDVAGERRQRAVRHAHRAASACAGEPLAPDRVAADRQRVGGRADGAGHCLTAHLNAVDIESKRAAPEGDRQVTPRTDRQRGGARRRHVRRAGVDLPRRTGRLIVRVERIGHSAGRAFHRDGAPAAHHRRIDPRFDRHPGGEIQRRRIGDRHEIVDAVE